MAFSTPVKGSSNNNLPTTTLPPPFSTTSLPRLQALYSDFSRQKSANPTSYQANVDWWRRALESLVSSSDSESLDRDGSSSSSANDKDRLVLYANRDLIERVKIPKVGKPLALGVVLSDLQTSNPSPHVLPLPQFVSSKTPLLNPSPSAFALPLRIASYVIGKPLWWALEQAGIVSDDTGGSGSRHDMHKDTSWYGGYVLVSLVESAAERVLEKQENKMGSKADALYTLDSFRKEFGSCVLGDDVDSNSSTYTMRETDAKVLVKYLEREKGLVVVDKDVIKFIDPAFTPEEERTITTVDRGILELKTAVRNLQAQIDGLHSKIDECTRKAASALKQNRRPAALTYLRSRKQLEDLLSKRLGSLTTLESTFIRVEAAAGDIDIMKSYESSTSTLRAILAHPSLERSAIDKTMEALAEANADAKEVDDAVRLGGNLAVGVDDAMIDDDELEAELRALAAEAEAERKTKESEETSRKLSAAGNVPSDVGSDAVKEKEAVSLS
ncbi:hypothetical protein CPC08DRAFT_631278 [Agrocybe pediades]|nr:hypothetical protein CPC08DRAFT_631278 [Agrocybe pediades]